METVIFSAYNEEEVYKILEARIGNSVVEQKVMEFIAKKVGQSSGDARKALEMAATAIQKCLGEIEHMDTEEIKKLDLTVDTLVKMKHAGLASREEATNLQDRISGLPLYGKLVLCALTTLTLANVCETTVGRLKRIVNDCLTGCGLEENLLQCEDFLTLLSTLVDAGLLRVSSNATADEIFDTHRCLSDVSKERIFLGMQLEDVEKALNRDLGQKLFRQVRECTSRIRTTE